jgi:hypothetical protein
VERAAGGRSADRAARDRPGRRRRRAAVLERHDGSPEGRHAHAPQPRREPRADRGPDPDDRGRRARRRPAVLPHLRHDGDPQQRRALRREGREMPRFDLEGFLRIIQEHKVTRAYVVPPIALALAKHPIVDEFDLSSLQLVFSGAAPLGEELEVARPTSASGPSSSSTRSRSRRRARSCAGSSSTARRPRRARRARPRSRTARRSTPPRPPTAGVRRPGRGRGRSAA